MINENGEFVKEDGRKRFREGRNEHLKSHQFVSVWTDDLPSKVIEAFCSGLKTKHSVCNVVGIKKSSYDRWMNPKSDYFKPELKEAFDDGVFIARGKFEEDAINSLTDRNYNSSLFKILMQNNFGYEERNSSVINAAVITDAEKAKELIQKYEKEF